MRRIWMVLGLVILACGALSAFNIFSKDSILEINAAAPDTSLSDGMLDLEGHLRISVPVTVSFEELTRLSNLAPITQSGEINDPLRMDALSEDRMHWRVNRSDIAVYLIGEMLGLSTTILGTAQLSGTVKIPGGLGPLLDGLNLKGVPFSQSGDVRATVSITSRPEIQPDWRITPNLDARVEIERADLPIAKLGAVDLRPVLQPVLDRAVAASLDALRMQIEDPALLRDPLEPVWTDLCVAFPVEMDGSQAWVLFKPQGVGVARPEVSAAGVTLAALIEATVSITAALTAPDVGPCPNLPDTVSSLSASDAGQAELELPGIVDWSWLEAQLSAHLSDPIVEDFGTLSLVNPVAMAFGNEVLIGVDLDLQSAQRLVPNVRGRIWLRTKPELDQVEGRLRFQDVALTTESATALGRVASWTADRVLAAFLDRELSIDLTDLETRVVASVNAQIAGFTDASADQATINADLNAFKISEFVVAPDGLGILLNARGNLTVEDLRLDLAQ